MAISVFPTPATSSSSINSSAITAVSANTMYEAGLSLDPSIYTITCVSSTVANIELYNGIGTLVASTSTTSGTVTINLASAVDRVRLWTNTGSNVVVTFTKTAAALTNRFSGTLDTITTTSTYTGTSTSGYGYAIVVGGGAGGAGGSCCNNTTAGGGSGGIGYKLVELTGSMSIVIGNGGAGSANSGAKATDGGATTFAGITAGGGIGGQGGTGGAGGTTTGATYNTTGGSGGFGGSSSANVYPFVVNGTTGGGGGGGAGTGSAGGGNGVIGQGGQGGSSQGGGGNATGRGAGGGGSVIQGAGGPFSGGSGTAGVVYVLRF
jgi:hypothetical protein